MSKILRYKPVKTRKPYVCFGCGRCFEPPCQMISVTATDDGTVDSYYLCKSCNEVAHDLEPCKDFGFGDLREAALEYEKNKIQLRKEINTVVIKAESTEQAIELVLKEYKKSDVCIGELFASIEIHGLSVEDVVKVYAKLYEQIEGDEICRVDEDGMRYNIGT